MLSSGINYTDTVFVIRHKAEKNSGEWNPPDAVNLYNLTGYSDMIVNSGYHPLESKQYMGKVKMRYLGCEYVGRDTVHFVILGEKL